MIIKKPLKELNASVSMGGSKSYTNRALMLAALGQKTVIKNYSPSRDSEVFITALKKLGFKITQTKTALTVLRGKPANKKVSINVKDAGTAMRFLTALCAAAGREVDITCAPRMEARPIKPLVTALGKLGANIKYLKTPGHPPLKILPAILKGGKVDINGGVSSQFISALLMLGPALEKGLTVNIKGSLVSRSYIDMTLSVMKTFGCKIVNKNYKTITVNPGIKQTVTYNCEADLSGASYFFAMGALNGRVRVTNINPKSAQGDINFPSALRRMGAKVTAGANYIEVAKAPKLKPINIDMTLLPDTAQTLAVLCAFAPGASKITGLKTLRVKETDRLAALSAELKKMGIKTKTTLSSITIYGGSPRSAKVKTYDDHRMAMSFAVAASALPYMDIKNPEVVEKSFPDFWAKLKKCGFGL